MRIAFTGSHRVGKTTLVEALGERLPGHVVVEEPYRLLEDEGHEFGDPPDVDDFEAQLRRALDELAEARPDALFDRAPLDFLAYLRAVDDEYELEPWLDEVREAMVSLDLIVFVPIEDPDRVPVADHEDRRLRRRVDRELRRLVLDDPYDLGVDSLEVEGDLAARLRQVLAAVR